jgi:hypothetical protein
MKSLLFLVLAVSFLWAASDSTYDTAITTINWKNQPPTITLDKKGNITASFSSQILEMLLTDSINGITWNIKGATNIWCDSLQRLDSIPKAKYSLVDIRDSLFIHTRKYFKQQTKTKRVK